MKLFSMNGKHLKGLLMNLLGKKANVMMYVISQMDKNGQHEWTKLDLDEMVKKTHYKPKKVMKSLKWLKRRNIIQLRKKAMLVRPTQAFINTAIPWEKKYMSHHKDIQGQEKRQGNHTLA